MTRETETVQGDDERERQRQQGDDKRERDSREMTRDREQRAGSRKTVPGSG